MSLQNRLILVAAVFSAFAAPELASARIQLRPYLIGGMAQSNARSDDVNVDAAVPKRGPNAGFGIDFGLFGAAVAITERGYFRNDVSVSRNWLMVPVEVQAKPLKLFTLTAGVFGAIAVGSTELQVEVEGKTPVDWVSRRDSEKITRLSNKDFGFTSAIRINGLGRGFLEGRYYYGLNSLYDGTDTIKLSTMVFALGVLL